MTENISSLYLELSLMQFHGKDAERGMLIITSHISLSRKPNMVPPEQR